MRCGGRYHLGFRAAWWIQANFAEPRAFTGLDKDRRAFTERHLRGHHTMFLHARGDLKVANRMRSRPRQLDPCTSNLPQSDAAESVRIRDWAIYQIGDSVVWFT